MFADGESSRKEKATFYDRGYGFGVFLRLRDSKELISPTRWAAVACDCERPLQPSHDFVHDRDARTFHRLWFDVRLPTSCRLY